MNADFKPGIDAPSSPSAVNDLEMRGSFEYPIVLDEEEDEENSIPTTPVSERPTEHLKLLRSCRFDEEIGSVPEVVYWSFLGSLCSVRVCRAFRKN